MIYRDVEGVDAFMRATIVSRRHNAAEIALKNFEIPTLGVWSRDEVTRIDGEGLRVFRPSSADGLEGRFPS